MISYLRREWQSYGETVRETFEDEDAVAARSGSDTTSERDIPTKADGRYCYKAEVNKSSYTTEVRGFALGEADERISAEQFQVYSGEVTNGYTFINGDPPCQTVIRIYLNVTGEITIDGQSVQGIFFEATSCIRTDNGYNLHAYRDRSLVPTEAQWKLITRAFSKNGCTGLEGSGQLSASVSIKNEKEWSYDISGETELNMYSWSDLCQQSRAIMSNADQSSRIIIYEQEDGFWKILTETLWIKLKPYFKPYGTMGGAFKNWLVDSGFEKYEYSYTYARDGKVVNATTVTYPKPTGKAGINQSWRPATDYNGQYVCMQPGDIFSVWYFEDRWQINQAIYAKNFQSDSRAEGELENTGSLIFRMNYIPSLAGIRNKAGKVKYRYINGGFAQVDAGSYTGMAIILNFECYGRKFYADSNNYPVDNALNPYICYIGDDYTVGGTHYRNGACSGYAAGYDDTILEHDMTISYTVMKPSDPDFVTGGESYGQSVTSELEVSIRNLQDQINSILAELNIQQVTSAVFSAVTSVGDLPNLFSNVTKIFSKTKDALAKLKGRKVAKTEPVKATMIIDKSNIDVPNVSIVNKMPEEYELGVIYNSMRQARLQREGKHDFPTFALATEMKLPYIQNTNTLTPKFKKYLSDRGLMCDDTAAIQFDPMDLTFSTLRKRNADILKYKIDPEIAHEVLSEMSTTATRSLFSLNVRKQISTNNEFGSPTYEQIINRILDDREILDIMGKLNRQTVGNLFQEFLDRTKDMLSNYV
ncbi:outer capsid spike protein VP4 [Rotavirus B]|nr:outer capsid spike protein VP4 [Rotavirus B]